MDTSQLCKLFIGGLNVQTTEAGLRAHFEAYGSLTDCVVVVNPLTKRSRCFGFVTYATAEEADAAVAASPHVLDGNNVELKRAVSREDSSKPGAHAKVTKLFVGGLKAGIEESHLLEHFSTFGSVEKVEIIADKESGKKRGFGFVHFANHDSADKAAVVKFHSINGHRVEVKKAVPREEIQQGPSGKSFRGRGRGGGGGSMNGFSGGREGGYGGYEGYGGGNQSYGSYGGYGDQGGYGNGYNGFGNYSQHMSAYGPMKGTGAGGSWGRNNSSGPYHGAGGAYGGTGSYGSF